MNKILRFDISMNDALVLEKGKKFNELVREVDDFLDRKLLVFVFNDLEEWFGSEFHDNSDFSMFFEELVLRLNDIKFKYLNREAIYFED